MVSELIFLTYYPLKPFSNRDIWIWYTYLLNVKRKRRSSYHKPNDKTQTYQTMHWMLNLHIQEELKNIKRSKEEEEVPRDFYIFYIKFNRFYTKNSLNVKAFFIKLEQQIEIIECEKYLYN